MKIKKASTIVFIVFMVLGGSLCSQSISQISYIIKQSIADTETIAVIFSNVSKDQVEGEARSASMITKKQHLVFGVTSKMDIAKQVDAILKMPKTVVFIFTDSTILTPETVKFISQKIGLKKIPTITNRAGDTLQGALLSVYKNNDKLEKHINKKLLPIFELTIPAEILAECITDAE